MDYVIKKLTSTDTLQAQELVALWQAEDGITGVPIPRAHYLERLLKQDNFHAFVATFNNEVIGGITAYEMPMFTEETTELFLYEIGVREPHRQKGIARRLINALKEICHTKNITFIYVGTDKDNEAAKKLYTATGGKMEEIAWFVYDL